MVSAYANPLRLSRLFGFLRRPSLVLALSFIAVGLVGGLWLAPPDYQQLDSARIMYVHVPSAWMALLVYTVMAVASACAYVWRHGAADLVAKAAAPIGAAFTFLCLATGSLWGRPMWGTWWEWGDARLMSVLILFFLYLGYIALWQAIEDPFRAARAARLLAIAGFMNVPIVKFSVDWWNNRTLHQPASVFRLDGPTIDPSMLWPLLAMAAGFGFYFLYLLAIRFEAERLAWRVYGLRAEA